MKRSKIKRNVIVGIMVAVVVGLGFGVSYLIRYLRYNDAIKQITISEVDLSQIQDGEYVGEYDVDFISAKVKVTVKNHEISDIEYFYHNNDRGDKATPIINDIVAQQKIKVDIVSGATNSSKVIQKAVELALTEK